MSGTLVDLSDFDDEPVSPAACAQPAATAAIGTAAAPHATPDNDEFAFEDFAADAYEASSAERVSCSTVSSLLPAVSDSPDRIYPNVSCTAKMPLQTTGAASSATAQEKAAAAHCWHVAYYQPYFHVDTEDVVNRLRCALMAYKGKTLFDTNQEADLYGPFWLSTTLALTLFVVSNLASFMSHPAESKTEWVYDFSLLMSGFTIILGYFVGAAFLLYLAVRCRRRCPQPASSQQPAS